MSMMNASTTFGVVRQPDVAQPRDKAGQAVVGDIVVTGYPVTQWIPSSKADAMVSHSFNEAVA